MEGVGLNFFFISKNQVLENMKSKKTLARKEKS